MPLLCDNTLFQNYYEQMSEMNDAMQVVFYYYCHHTATLSTIFDFGLVYFRAAVRLKFLIAINRAIKKINRD